MAAPVDAARATTDQPTGSLSQAVNLPGSISSGDILFAVVRATAGTTISWPAGWTELDETSLDASDDTQSCAWRIADGTEGATITVTLGTSRPIVALCYRITGGDSLVIGTPASNSANANPNSPSLDALRSGYDVLWLSVGGFDRSATLTSGPSGYSNATLFVGTASGAIIGVLGASKQVTSDDGTEDPGTWAVSVAVQNMMWTVAVYTANTRARLSQGPTEAVVSPTTGKARVSQVPVEVVMENISAAGYTFGTIIG
jgi:hypothetical protein